MIKNSPGLMALRVIWRGPPQRWTLFWALKGTLRLLNTVLRQRRDRSCQYWWAWYCAWNNSQSKWHVAWDKGLIRPELKVWLLHNILIYKRPYERTCMIHGQRKPCQLWWIFEEKLKLLLGSCGTVSSSIDQSEGLMALVWKSRKKNIGSQGLFYV